MKFQPRLNFNSSTCSGPLKEVNDPTTAGFWQSLTCQNSSRYHSTDIWLIATGSSQKTLHLLSVSNGPTSVLSDISITLRKSHGTIFVGYLAKWLSVCLWTKWLWFWVQLQLLKVQISCLLWARSSLTFRQPQSVDSTLKRIWDMIRTYSPM